ncbi:tRNA threonylcarbamoyladenosine biosynthesis protein TsaB [Litorimonas taeanensis]|uniref:tRNA threonylcarbamoyladenosine biosynthesis protein TsaB n=1 Tax=Litorimonas taeanensis TaxID=568099 RepID=A0A420WEU5_9PROT|nr:tRNA (adenosine(37)-N6)-threonylcarbamoyltransferase complex dimerization subunit type 1 TsaB [Litorimonas taeanensis]RKQ69504.1 tRNA threonylcarbamoyladenosine biosynthesis protein TsaB [Litorimonas taeanensis]
MLTLGLDTTGKACSAALVDEGRVIAHCSEPIGRGHAERLAPLVHELIYNAGRNVDDISRVAVCTGPGSFTGQRVALSFAKGFALPRKLPVIGLSSLEIWAREADPENNKLVVSIADVRRGELCWAVWKNGICEIEPVTQKADEAETLIDMIGADVIIRDAPISTILLAWLAQDETSQSAPATPLYSRAPDAKLPGGITPKAQKPKPQFRKIAL